MAVGVILEVRVEPGEVRLRPSRGGGGNEGEGKGQRGQRHVEAVHLDTEEEDLLQSGAIDTRVIVDLHIPLLSSSTTFWLPSNRSSCNAEDE